MPEIAVQPPRALASPEMTALLQQRQNIEAQKNQVESQLIQAKQHQQSLLQQQASGTPNLTNTIPRVLQFYCM